jgi:hypothetical protein
MVSFRGGVRRKVVIAVTLVFVAGREARSCGGPDRAIVMS